MNKTKYFRREVDYREKTEEFVEIPLNRDNWWYVQLDATIRTAFNKYKLKLPKYVIIREYSDLSLITIVRENIDSEEEMKRWYFNKVFVQDELKNQTDANSTDEIRYSINII